MANEEEAFSTFLQALPQLMQQEILTPNTEEQMKMLSNSIQKIIDAKAVHKKNNARSWLHQLEDVASDIDDFLQLTSPKGESHKIPESLGNKSKIGSLRNQRGNQKIALQKMKDIRMKLEKISRKLSPLSLQSHTEEDITKMSLKHSPVETLTVSNENEDRGKIIDLLLSIKDSDQAGSFIVPIIRRGGVKTTEIAQSIFDDKRLANHFSRMIWVNASKVIDLGKLSRLIQKPASTLFWVHKTLDNSLEEEQILIILDDIRETSVDNKMLRLQVNSIFSARKVAVSTPVLMSKFGLPEWDIIKDKLKLGERCSPQESWTVFKECVTRATNGNENHDMNLQLEGIGRNIVKKLEGSPSLIRTIGYILSLNLEPYFWNWISESEVWKLPLQEFVLAKIIELSYHRIPRYRHCSIRPPCLDQWWWCPEERQEDNNSRKRMVGKYAAR